MTGVETRPIRRSRLRLTASRVSYCLTTAAVATPAGVPAPAAMPEPAPVGVQPPMVSAAPAMAPMAPTSPAAPATSVTSTPAPVASAITPPAAPPVLPAPTTGAEGFGYMVGSVGLGMGAKAQTRARSAVPAGHIATSVGGAAAAEHPQGRARKRPRSIVDPGYRYGPRAPGTHYRASPERYPSLTCALRV